VHVQRGALCDSRAVTLNLGTALAGKTFRLRFRVGTDAVHGAGGWEVDNVAFTGLVGTPFPTLVPDPGHCAALVQPPGSSTGDPVDPGNDAARRQRE
jgi:hypothetical protein